ncbi:TPA: LPD5 domain-containing protein, partial [Salmonella enterica subsp. enterica serovar Muenchen]
MPLIPDVRPEAQKTNPNRTGLNIAQPGEQPAFDYDSYLDSLTPENVRDYSTGANLKDYGIAVASGAANLPEGAGALANFGGQWLEKKAGELSPDHFVAKSALSDIGSFLHKSGRAVQEGVGDWKQQLESGYSQPAKNALEQGAAGSISGLTLNLANVFGDLGATVLTGGLEGLAAKGATAALLKREAVSGLVRKGLTEEAATKVADDAMEIASRKATAAQAGKTASKYGFIASGTADAQGNTAAAAAQGILNASPQQLAGSPTFVNLYQSVQSDPQYAHLSDEDKVQVAKEQLADRVGMSLATDPKLLAVNIASTMMGDKAVADMALNGVSKSIAGGFAKGALRDGVTGGLQSGYSQYAQNVARDEDAGIATDHMQGVAKATGEGSLLGGIIGGGAGTVSGIRGRRNGVSTEQAEKSSDETPETPAGPETTTPADPIEAYRQQFSGLSRDELLQHYANADFAPEGDADAVYRKHAANGLLRDMDRADQVKGIVDEMRSKPRGEVLEEYRTLSEKEKRNDADEMRLDAAREVLRPQQPETETRPQQTAEPQKQESSGRRSQYDPDDLDIPAFMRDPRFRDFTDEPTEVQQHLTRGNAPTSEDLVHEQMAKGDAGPTDYELAERPRLPSPGDIHPGQGYPLPGDVRHLPDESPAGRGGRYTTTGEVQGQSYQKGRQTVAPEGVQRQGETFQGEKEHRELPAPERQELPRPEEPGLTSHEQGGMAVKEGSEGEKNPLQKPEKAGQQQISTEKSGEKIDDFGEVIHGAAKHRRAALAEELNTDKTADDYKTQPLSKLFPKPDYEKMAAEGTDNKTLAMLALLRSMIPAKPRVAHRLNRWAKQVEEVRDTAGQLLDGSLPADKFIDRIRQERGSHYGEMVKTWEMLHRLSPAQLDQAAGYRVKTDAWSMFNGKEYNPPKVFHTLENEKGRRVLDSDDLNDLHKKAKAYFDQQAASPEPADSKTKLDIYQNRRTGEVFIAYGKNKTSLQGGFKTVAEARDYAKTRRAELLEKLNKLREQSREEQRNASNRDRTGPERHEGNVTPETFSDAFGFRGVQFGNYVEGPRRQSDLNRAYDSLMDMADVLKVPAKALSLNGRLGLAFGARGKGGKNAAAAHYEPDQVAINLTKGNGAGSLAHEWFHALDNYFGQYDAAREGEITSGDKFMTSNNKRWTQWNDKEKEYLHPVRQEVYDAFKGVMKAIKESALPERSLRLDDVRSKPYWSTDIEMAARAFERYVQDKAKSAGVENDFLVNIRKADDHGSPDTYAYPTQAELDGGIRQAFDHLFSTLKTRETDKGVAFYSRKGVKRTPEGNFISDTSHSKEAKGSSVAKVKAIARGVMDRIKDNTLNVRVVKSQAEAQELAGESFDGYGKVHAFYRPDEHEIVLVADNIPDGRTVREKLRHEIIHHAMEQVVTPAEYKTIVDNVLKTRNSDNAAIRETWRKVDADYGNESPEVQAGEFLAHMAEKEPGKLGAAWNRVVALIKAVLRRTGLFQPSDLNDIGYVRDAIRTLGQRVREGYVPREGGDVSYSRTGKPDPFKVPEGDGERYRRDLAKMMKSLRSTDMTVDIGRTPPVLRHIGAPDLPLVISRDVIRKATNGVKHDVPMDVIERLPELMHDPKAVYQSATEKEAVVMLLDAIDKNGDPVITAVHMKAVRSRLEINRVASVYGTENGKKIHSMEREGLALYRKEKSSRDNPLHSGLQLPKGEHSYHGSGNNVLSPDDIRKGPYYSRSGSDLSPEETLSARFVRAMQDKFQVLKAVQDNIRKSGGKLDDSNDAYLAEELFHGKAENDLNVMKERYVKPLAHLLAEYDIPQSALDEYLYARHAPERNAHIAEINPKMPDGGSGMTNAEAAGIMDRVRRSGKQAQYDRLAGIVDDMLARLRELIKSAGLESEGTVDAWQDAYKHYVPLKGQDADGTVLPRTGRGYVISGKESKMAMGRKSKAQSPSTQAMQDLTASLIRNRKNEVGNAFLKLVQDNPDKDYWQVFTDDKPDTTRRIVEKTDPETGEKIRQVEEMPVPMAMMSDKYFTTKKDGKTYYIKLHDERLMRAMKNMGPETGNAVIQTLARVNRFMSAMNTSLNPEFLVSNFVRDMQTAVMNLKAEQGRDDGKLNGRDIAMKTVRDSGIAMKAVY